MIDGAMRQIAYGVRIVGSSSLHAKHAIEIADKQPVTASFGIGRPLPFKDGGEIAKGKVVIR